MAYKIPEHYRLTKEKAKSYVYISKEILSLVTEAHNREDGYFALPAMNKRDGMMYLVRATLVRDEQGIEWRIVAMNIPSQGRTPNWEEQHYLKKFFFDEDDFVLMVHPGKSTYVGDQTYWLHFFQPVAVTQEQYKLLLPPIWKGGYPFRQVGAVSRTIRAIKKDIKETFTTKTETNEHDAKRS